MLKNYFKIAIRNIRRNKMYSLINIAGLTLGITCSGLLFMLVIDELSFDNMHTNKDRIYRVVEIDDSKEATRYYGITAPPLGPAMSDEYPEVENATRLFQFGGHINFEKEDTKYQERSYYYADRNFFEVFDATWIEGDPSTALDGPNAIVIDESWAKTLFGTTQDVVGKKVESGGETVYRVTGVIKKLPQNTHLQYKVLVSLPSSESRFKAYNNDWSAYGAGTYLLLNAPSDVQSLSAKIPAFIKKHFTPEQQRNFYLQPMSDIHFNSQDIEYATDSSRGQKAYVYIFMAIGIFMLIIACINYMNLATAKSLHRGKEIGIRKASGAVRQQLVIQFLSESILIALLSFILSVGLVDLVLPYFNEITGKAFVFNVATFGKILMLLLAVTLIVGLLSGIYPALFLSKLKPAKVLKGAMSTGKGSVILRKALVITQFTLSITMIIATVVAIRQIDYIQNKSLGFNNEQVMVVDINSGNVRSRFETMKQEFLKSPFITDVAVSSRVPGEWKTIREIYVNKLGSADSMRTSFMGFDADILRLYKMEIVEGTNFSGNAATDSLHVLINQAAAEALDMEDPVGQFIETVDDQSESGEKGKFQIVGVVKDFNFQSLHHTINPMIIGYRLNPYQAIDYFSLKFKPDHTAEAIADAQKVHNAFDTRTPMEYHFLDEQWSAFYESDKQARNIFTIGAGITIFVACLGLFGLASFIILKRTKEIGVRKVLGASIMDLMVLLSKTFAFQVLVAFLLGAPIAWYFMSQWLDNFAYRFNMGIGEYLLAGGVTLFIALASVSYRVIKATQLNPASTLKSE